MILGFADGNPEWWDTEPPFRPLAFVGWPCTCAMCVANGLAVADELARWPSEHATGETQVFGPQVFRDCDESEGR